MTDIIDYRGPDDEGFVIFQSLKSSPLVAGGKSTPVNTDKNLPYFPISSIDNLEIENALVAFGHRRLAILDVSPYGHQPMCYGEENLWITYNGEIYNYIELRKELESLGYAFLSHSDTEVILAAYAEWGADCLNRLNGMWAFAIYDRKDNSVFLARDRFGVKPLYHWTSPDGVFYFGSEIKQFTVLPQWRATINAQRSYDFLIWGLCDHTAETMFDGVHQIRPGHYALINVGDLKVNPVQWYTLQSLESTKTDDEFAQEFRRLLDDSVRLRLRADVPVGSCLSGGLDSSSLVCLMNNQLGKGSCQKTFSATAEVEKYNELKWIDAVVNETGVEAHYVHPSLENLFDLSERITWHQDEPFGSTSIYAQWSVFELASKNDVTVMLDGQGADEQLGGYHGFFAPLLYGLLKSGKWGTLVQEIRSIKRLHGYSERRSIENILNMMLPECIKTPLRRIVGRSHKAPSWLDVAKLGAQTIDPHHDLGSYTDSIRSLSHTQLTSSNLQGLLHWEDRNSMAHSLESRVPFLDYRLVEFSLSLPDKYKISNGITKVILREAMSGILPDKIRDRVDKLGFATPEEVWIRENGAETFKQKLKESIDTMDGIIKPDALTYFDDVVAGRKPFNFTIWRIINFAQWVRIFNVDLNTARVA